MNRMIIGSFGTGKSQTAKAMLSQYIESSRKIIVIDPYTEYIPGYINCKRIYTPTDIEDRLTKITAVHIRRDSSSFSTHIIEHLNKLAYEEPKKTVLIAESIELLPIDSLVALHHWDLGARRTGNHMLYIANDSFIEDAVTARTALKIINSMDEIWLYRPGVKARGYIEELAQSPLPEHHYIKWNIRTNCFSELGDEITKFGLDPHRWE